LGTPNRRAARSPRPVNAALVLPLALLLGLSSPSVQCATNVRVVVDGQSITVQNAETVREALEQARVTLGEDDQVSPAPGRKAPPDGVIRVQRVTFTQGTVDVKVPYKLIVRPATRGNRPYHPTVTAEGRNGLKRVTYRAKMVDGQEVERTTVSETVVREPVHEIVTSRKPATLGSRGAYAGKRTITVLATAYDPGPGSCGKYADGRTCNGKRAGYGIIAVDPKMIPLGTKLFVPGYGFGVAADVGGAIKGNHVDLGFNSRPASFAWGKKWVKVTILD
jgi:3D (Asp-Asp-Asp) domain-containing protein